MNLVAGNKEEKLKLDVRADSVLASGDPRSITDHIQLSGKLRGFYEEENEIKGYYEELITLLGFEKTDPHFRMYVPDMTEISFWLCFLLYYSRDFMLSQYFSYI